MNDRIYWIWLSLSLTPGKENFRKLIERFKTAEAIFFAEPFEIAACIGEKSSDYKALVDKRGNVLACQLMIKLIDAQQATHYMNLKNLKEYTVGWVTNRVGNIPLSACENYEVTNIKPMDQP